MPEEIALQRSDVLANGEDKNAAAQTSEQSSQAGTDAATGQNGETVNDAAFSDNANGAGDKPAEGEGAGATVPAAEKKPQSREKNAENARRRREAERQRELDETRNKAIIDALGGKNPYTDGEMKDAEDVREFLRMQEIEKAGGDPVADYSKHQKERERAEREQAQKDAEQRAWYEKDRADFVAKYPDVELAALIENKSFRIFAEGKVGERPLSEIYESYLAMTGEIEAAAKRTAAQSAANAAASPGSLSGGGQVESDFVTREQVLAHRGDAKWMNEHYDIIHRSIPKW